MIKFMGNGKRIENVIRSLCSGYVSSIYHCKSGISCCISRHTTELVSAVCFMNSCGYRDVFVLYVAEYKEVNA